MNPRIRKMAKALDVSLDQAKGLVEAGFTSENRAREASAEELEQIHKVGPATAAKIRGED